MNLVELYPLEFGSLGSTHWPFRISEYPIKPRSSWNQQKKLNNGYCSQA